VISLNFRDSKPIWEQVRDNMIKLFVSGALEENEKLPSVRELAQQLAINPNTIQRAYRELEAQGYIYSVPGKGSFSSGRIDAVEARKKELMTDFEKLTGELLGLGAEPEELIEAVRRVKND
jgi:GntR family transcriptional regulator